jgi:sugar transferase (PEP-CTERM/EpsH1 system associated)
VKILYLAHRVPYPPDKGDRLRAFRQIEHLAAYHRVWCVCLSHGPDELERAERLNWHCQEVFALRLRRRLATMQAAAGLALGSTATQGYFRHWGLSRALDDLTRRVDFDVVLAFSSSMASPALRVRAPRRVLDMCDLDSEKWLEYAESAQWPMNALYRLEGRRLAKRERQWIEAFDATMLITKAEARAIERDVSPGKLHIVGNGVSLPESDDLGRSMTDRRGPVVGFVGQMDYRPNVDAVCWFVRRCWPTIRTQCPGARFQIVGRSPAPAVQELDSKRGVEVVGEVPDATRAVLGFDVSVAPMQIGRGLQNKVLEAMAAARGIVLTSAAAEGIEARNDREYIVADDPCRFTDAVLELIYNEQRRESLGRAARTYVARHHRWEVEMRKLEAIVTGTPPAPAPSRPMVEVPTDRPAKDRAAVPAI